ncbi:hypothetical protein LEP1GSC020_3815 [Leptospira interrogans serovar Grippotyphosa str. 2006006986]|uniref:Uncharacterized protein n=1 Tax=Leptospira interrogans TaxID=173 RepID=A0AAV9FV51_LEPIR|nr:MULTISPECIES: hypothetical protein [Leptospira]AJR14779.1 hypothetical protein LIL_12177 [Leptospira interrogans serovar Linhai str. 56609]EKO85556.1 hypothetical protein LEP1GSC009_1662 [Leptospira interrogans serovar Grippotyphosa str. Andaman]EKP85990.1 hypothetical protein LEP1GSC020_3815 [Leptospira interrogans serovar Grippotyphosa str. 2006006986]EMJ53903.1 hypothetical protein LEP1GSC111_0150 [Leptospira interrogans str. UT126]EMN66176.1 hypothetical protein LEP1GSC098_4122 [Leptosp
MKKPSFDVLAKKYFKFLELDYNFRFIKSLKESWGYEILYLNQTTGVKIVYEYREAYIFIFLYRLIDGKLVEDPGEIVQNTLLNSFGLDDIINIRNPLALLKATYEYPENSHYHDKTNGWNQYISDFANNLKQYANDVLAGNFEIFEKVDPIVKERAKRR